MTKEIRTNQLMMVKALELVDENLAIELLSNEKLDRKDLSFIVQDGLMNKGNLKLSPTVLMAGIRNIMSRIETEMNQNETL